MHRPDPNIKPEGVLPLNEEEERSEDPCQSICTEKAK